MIMCNVLRCAAWVAEEQFPSMKPRQKLGLDHSSSIFNLVFAEML